jgi:hypothetical protein
MNRLRYHRTTASLHWLLAVAVVFGVCLPAHYHLHHQIDNTIHRAHSIDLYLAGSAQGHSHHDAETTIIQTVLDSIAKDRFTVLAPPAVLAVVLLLLPVFILLSGRLVHVFEAALCPSPPRLTPPLRAPPLR